MTEKSILEQALLQVQNLEEAVKQNAKGILASTMKEELKDLLKESLEEEEKVEEEAEVSEQPTSDEEDTDDMSDDDAEADDAEADDAENMDDLDNEPSKDIESLDSEVGGDEMGDEESMDSEDSLELPSDDMGMDDEDVMDMTGASDEEVLKVFKAMKPEDGIVVKKDGNNVEFETADDEYIIKLDDEGESEVEEELGMEEEMMPSEEESETEEETIYEIEMEEEEMEEEKEVEATEGESKEEEPKEVEATEAARTFANDVRVPANQGKKFKAGRHEMNEEVENLKKQNAEYKKALILFKEKLNEVAVFNANLAYATRLFTEHSTTKQEKLNILKRFDSVSTMNESKSLFSTIKSELGTKTTVTETVAEKISNTPTTSSSTDVLSESKAYENPQFSRIKEMMKKIK
jgi:CRP-like cAMP-binding protein